MRLIYDECAYQDGVEAASWYGQQGADLRDRFLNAWKTTALRVLANPELYRCFRGDLRKARFEVFPYVLVFRIRGDEIQVAAMMHTSRKPGYWENRD